MRMIVMEVSCLGSNVCFSEFEIACSLFKWVFNADDALRYLRSYGSTRIYWLLPLIVDGIL